MESGSVEQPSNLQVMLPMVADRAHLLCAACDWSAVLPLGAHSAFDNSCQYRHMREHTASSRAELLMASRNRSLF
jgi:hypothetical protein